MKVLGLLTLSAALLLTATAHGVSYHGSLSGAGGGITATAAWNSGGTVIEWWVVDENDGASAGKWKYTYEFTVPAKDISHINIEVSDTFTVDLLSPKPAGTSVDDFGNEGGSSPGIPEEFHAIKFDGVNTKAWSVTFETSRNPIWGDFYAKDGKDQGVDVYAYNDGFGSPDSDPDPFAFPAASGSVQFHLLVPDTLDIGQPPDDPVIPEPMTMATFGLAAAALGRYARRRRTA